MRVRKEREVTGVGRVGLGGGAQAQLTCGLQTLVNPVRLYPFIARATIQINGIPSVSHTLAPLPASIHLAQTN